MDHIGPAEHESFDDYVYCKSLLFRQCRIGIVNKDDPHLEQILQGHTCQVETFGFSEEANLRAEDTRLVSRPGYLGIAYKLPDFWIWMWRSIYRGGSASIIP